MSHARTSHPARRRFNHNYLGAVDHGLFPDFPIWVSALIALTYIGRSLDHTSHGKPSMIKAILFALLFVIVGAVAFALLAPLLFRGADFRKLGAAAFPVILLVCGGAGLLFSISDSRLGVGAAWYPDLQEMKVA